MSVLITFKLVPYCFPNKRLPHLIIFVSWRNSEIFWKAFFVTHLSLTRSLFHKREFKSNCLMDSSLNLFAKKIPATNKGVIQKRKKNACLALGSTTRSFGRKCKVTNKITFQVYAVFRSLALFRECYQRNPEFSWFERVEDLKEVRF